MVDLTEFLGENAMRASIEKKRDKAKEKMDKLMTEKVKPLAAELGMYEKMLQAMDDAASSKLMLFDVEKATQEILANPPAKEAQLIGDPVTLTAEEKTITMMGPKATLPGWLKKPAEEVPAGGVNAHS